MADGTAPAEAGKTTSLNELLQQLNGELTSAAYDIDQADSLINVAGFALRHQDCDMDHDAADVLQQHAYPALQGARDAIVNAEELVAKLQDIARGLCALGSLAREVMP